MTTPESVPARDLRVRPLCRQDARGVARLVADYFAEIGANGAMSAEQTEQLFARPWLEGGSAFVLEHGPDTVGYGFVRPSQWRGTPTVQFGLTLKRGYREREVYHILTDPLLTAAMDLARRRGINTMNIHLRSTDTGHPPVMLELGFREHRVSMLGFSHDLKYIPPRLLPPGFSFRLARLPDENATVLQLLNAAFDDRDRQGEPLGNTYLDFISGKSGFEPEQVQFVEGGGSPIGCIIADAATHEPGSTYTVLELAVLADYRRRGIGSALLCRQLEWLRTRGARTALASMFSSNVAATLFWRLGFRPDPQKTFRFFLRDTATPSTADQGGNHDALL